MWQTLGNVGYVAARIDPDGSYRGVPVTVIHPTEELSGFNLVTLLSTSRRRSQRLIDAGYRDAKRELTRLRRARSTNGGARASEGEALVGPAFRRGVVARRALAGFAGLLAVAGIACLGPSGGPAPDTGIEVPALRGRSRGLRTSCSSRSRGSDPSAIGETVRRRRCRRSSQLARAGVAADTVAGVTPARRIQLMRRS